MVQLDQFFQWFNRIDLFSDAVGSIGSVVHLNRLVQWCSWINGFSSAVGSTGAVERRIVIMHCLLRQTSLLN